jgi:hypothetical protein
VVLSDLDRAVQCLWVARHSAKLAMLTPSFGTVGLHVDLALLKRESQTKVIHICKLRHDPPLVSLPWER